MSPGIVAAIAGGGVALVVLATGLRVIAEYQRGVVLRLGRRGPVLAAGLRYILPLGIDRLTRVDLRSEPLAVAAHEVMTHDGVPVRVSMAIHLQVLDPLLAVTRVIDYRESTRQLARAALRDVVADVGLRDLLLNQAQLRAAMGRFIGARAEAWGIAVTDVDLEEVLLPDAMQRAMARHAELRSGQPIAAVPADDAAVNLARQLEGAAKLLADQPSEIQTRFLQALTEVQSGESNVVVVPLPTELIQPFVDLQGRVLPAPRDAANEDSGTLP